MSGLRRGFTLIELLIVMGILGALATVVIIRFVGVERGAQDAKRKAELKEYQNALEVYATTNDTTYPSTGGSSVIVSSLCGGPLYADTCPNDPRSGSGGFGYYYASDGNDYILHAKMEKPTTDEYFVLCSSGQAGLTTSNPSGQTDCSGITFLP